MTSVHQVQTLTAGDDWEIDGTLHDVNDAPLNLGGVVIEWGLLDENRQIVINGHDTTISIIDQALGRCRIRVPKEVTATLPPGSYTDACRITAGDLTATMWIGPITVNASPFRPRVVASAAINEASDAADIDGAVT